MKSLDGRNITVRLTYLHYDITLRYSEMTLITQKLLENIKTDFV